MNNKQIIAISSVLLVIMVTGVVLFLAMNNKNDNKTSSTSTNSNAQTTSPTQSNSQISTSPGQTTVTAQEFTSATLSKFDGKNGNKCYVAIDDKVYFIDYNEVSNWSNGQHQPAGSAQICGTDGTSFISRSPHGKSKLSQLEVMGTFKK